MITIIYIHITMQKCYLVWWCFSNEIQAIRIFIKNSSWQQQHRSISQHAYIPTLCSTPWWVSMLLIILLVLVHSCVLWMRKQIYFGWVSFSSLQIVTNMNFLNNISSFLITFPLLWWPVYDIILVLLSIFCWISQ